MNKLQKGSTVTFYHNGKTEAGIIWGINGQRAIIHSLKRFIKIKITEININ